MEDRRRFARFSVQLDGQYFLKEVKEGWQECEIIDVSRKGVKIRSHTSDKIAPGAQIILEVTVPGELEPLVLKGIVKWAQQEENDFTGGIELTEELDEITFSKLS